MFGEPLELPKSDPQDPDDIQDADEDGLEEELTEDDEEEQARAVNGEVCENCGAEFEDENGAPALCQMCFDTAEDAGVTDHAPLSKYPVVPA